MTDKKKKDDWRNFDGFFNFDDMDEEFDAIRQYMDKILEGMVSGEMGMSDMKPFVYGFSVKVGPDGQPHIERFGNTHYDAEVEPDVMDGIEPKDDAGAREPLTDILENGDSVSVTIEIPGVEKKDISLEVVGETLVISVNTPERRYFKEVGLPHPVDPDSAKATYNNGVLDIVLKKVAKERKSTKIKVE